MACLKDMTLEEFNKLSKTYLYYVNNNIIKVKKIFWLSKFYYYKSILKDKECRKMIFYTFTTREEAEQKLREEK